jgi:hypothetical protein
MAALLLGATRHLRPSGMVLRMALYRTTQMPTQTKARGCTEGYAAVPVWLQCGRAAASPPSQALASSSGAWATAGAMAALQLRNQWQR